MAVNFEDQPDASGDDTVSDLVLLATNEEGYENLMDLVSRSFLDTEPGLKANVPFSRVQIKSGGLIVLTGASEGPINSQLRDGHFDLAKSRLELLQATFGDRLYVELQRHNMKGEEDVEPELLNLAYEMNIPVVATNESFFPNPDDYEAHDALIAISEGRVIVETDRRQLTPDHALRPARK